MSNLPRCACGGLKGQYNLGVMHDCGTQVAYQMEQDIEPVLWMAAPKSVSAMINPHMFIILSEFFTASGFSVIHFLTDTTYRVNNNQSALIDTILNTGIKRGYNYFCDNFDFIFDTLLKVKNFTGGKRAQRGQELRTFINSNRDKLFTGYLPVPNKALLIVENTVVGKYVDFTIINAIDAIRMILSIDTKENMMQHVRENRTAKALAALSSFYKDYYKENLSSKEGTYRHNVFGSLSHFSFRAVISSITKRHKYDEIYIPWAVGITVLQVHLMNKLLKRGYTTNESFALLNEYAQRYHPVLDELFKELIDESPDKGIPCTSQRNPSLKRSSAQAVRITQVKTDVNDITVSLSILSVVGWRSLCPSREQSLVANPSNCWKSIKPLLLQRDS